MEQTNKIIDRLIEDKLGNINLIDFIENNGIISTEYIGKSLLMRGKSDRIWVYIKCSDKSDMIIIKEKLNDQDRCFGAIEDWMMPTLVENKKLLWDLSQYYLPESVNVPKPGVQTKSLSENEASIIYENSEYRNFISEEYIKDRIRRGISKRIYENSKLVGWGLTQDDGALGFLHVLNDVRRKGYGLNIMLSLIEEVRQAGKIPFGYIEKDNHKSINLVSKLGFVKQRECHWFEIN